MKIKEIISHIEEFAPVSYQESYDNSGLIIGNSSSEVNSALLTIDVTEEIIDEAIAKKCGLIISHHPLIFDGIKRLNGNNSVEKIIIKAIKNDIAIYSAHTNLDNVESGVSGKICEKLNLKNCKVLIPKEHNLLKLVVFVPQNHIEKVREALFNAGAGHIGNYDKCSFSSAGEGSFRASEKANPFVGEKNEIHFEAETKLETIFPKHLKNKIIQALLSSHPYEEVAYDLFLLENQTSNIGAGMIGELENEVSESEFLEILKQKFKLSVLRHSPLLNKKIKRIAVCGGSGSTFLKKAISEKADVYVSGDFKYHQFFESENKILITDIGHFESEQYSVEIFYDILKKNIPNFAVNLSEINTNPINYY